MRFRSAVTFVPLDSAGVTATAGEQGGDSSESSRLASGIGFHTHRVKKHKQKHKHILIVHRKTSGTVIHANHRTRRRHLSLSGGER